MSGPATGGGARHRWIRLIAPVAVIGVLIAGYLLLAGREPAGEEAGEEQALPPFYTGDPESVATITIEHTGLTLQRRSILETDAGLAWIYPAAPGAPLREPQVLQVVDAAIGLRPLRVIAEGPGDLSAYGLDAPRGRIELVSAGGDRLNVLLGSRAATGTSYAMVDGRDAVYTVSGDAVYLLSREPAALVDTTLPTFEPVLVRRMRVRGTGGELKVRYDAFHDASQPNERAAYLITAPYAGPVLVDDAALSGVLARLRDDLTGDVADGIVVGATADDPALGLAEPAFELEVEDAEGTYHLLIGSAAGATHRYAALAGRPTVYRLGNSRVDTLDRLRPFDLVARAVAEVDYDLVQEMDFTAGEASYRVTIDREGEAGTTVYRLGGTTLSAVDAAELLEHVNGLRVEDDIPGDSRVAGVRPVLTVTWRLAKPELPEWSVEVLPHDVEFHAVRRGGSDPAPMFLIDRRSIAGLLDLLARMAGTAPAG